MNKKIILSNLKLFEKEIVLVLLKEPLTFDKFRFHMELNLDERDLRCI